MSNVSALPITRFAAGVRRFVVQLLDYADDYQGADAAIIYACLAIMFAGVASIIYSLAVAAYTLLTMLVAMFSSATCSLT